MRLLHYAGESVHVSYDICDAVFRYARALANANLSDIVRIPILANGRRDFSNMLLGPASSLFCTPGSDSDVDLEDDKVLSYMRERTLALGPSQVQPEAPGAVANSDAYDEYGSL